MSKDVDLKEARSLYGKLREAINAESFVAESQRAVTQICDRALLTVDDDYCQQMFCEIDRQAQELSTTGRSDRRAMGFTLEAIRYRLRSLETLYRTGEPGSSAEPSFSK